MDTKEKKLKEIKWQEGKFTANGTTYYIEESISQDRWNWYERLEIEIGLGLRFKVIMDKLQAQWTHINAAEFGDSAVICRDLMTGIARNLEKRTPEVIKMCALFMNTADEDRRYMTEELIKKKESDWREEGIDMRSFFHFAIAIIPGFITAYGITSPVTSDNSSQKDRAKI